MNKKILWFVLLLYCCNISHVERFQYFDNLNEKSRAEIIKSMNIDKNVKKLYLHEVTLSDNKYSEALLDTLCAPTEDDKRMFYFYILNDIVRNADGALAELLGQYCMKYINQNADYALVYFCKHRDVSNEYSTLIATELYYNDISMSNYKQQLIHLVKSEKAQKHLPIFLNNIEHTINCLIESQ